jgi:hypothetical protein
MMAHSTRYAGVNFRSRLEAKWAAFFDADMAQVIRAAKQDDAHTHRDVVAKFQAVRPERAVRNILGRAP